MIKDEYFILSNGVKIPKVGFGTWQAASGEEAYSACLSALKLGYTHIDTALVYQNEKSVSRAIKDSGIPREDIFITTKLPANIKTYNGAMQAFEESVQNLDTDYIDLYMIHAPWPWDNVGADCTKGNIEAWRALIDLYEAKKVRAIGVSNFHVKDIVPLIEATNIVPMVNQIRFFIGNTQEEITKYCQDNDILVEAYSPLATGAITEDEHLKEMAIKYNKSIPQICIRYCIERNTLPLPKSVHKERIASNIDLDFEISKEDMEYLNSLHHIGPTRPLRS